MKGRKYSFFVIRRGDKRLSEKITARAREGYIFSSISPLGVITFVKSEPSNHVYRLEDPDLPKDLQLYDEGKYEEVFRSKSYVVFKSKKPLRKDAFVENVSYEPWEYTEETNWLRQKAAEGLYLRKKQGDTYFFSDGNPEDWSYSIDFQVVKDPKSYLDGFKSDGWEYVCSQKNDHYFRRRGTISEKISVKSKVKALKKKIRIRWVLIFWLWAMLILGGIFLTLGYLTDSTILIKKILFYGVGGFFIVGAVSFFIGVFRSFLYLKKKNALLKYRGETK